MPIQLMFVVLATLSAPALAAGQVAGRDKLRAHSQGFRREVITGARQ